MSFSASNQSTIQFQTTDIMKTSILFLVCFVSAVLSQPMEATTQQPNTAYPAKTAQQKVKDCLEVGVGAGLIYEGIKKGSPATTFQGIQKVVTTAAQYEMPECSDEAVRMSQNLPF
jgi:hypothetical protein